MSALIPTVEVGYGKGWPLVRGKCPACGRRALFLAADGYVTCAAPDCSDPSAATDVLDTDAKRGGETCA